MTYQEKTDLSQKVISIIHTLQCEPDDWVDLARIGAPLAASGIQYKMLGFPKLRPFLEEFREILMFKEEAVEGKPPVAYVRPRDSYDKNVTGKPVRTKAPVQDAAHSHSPRTQNPSRKGERYPTEKSSLFSWAHIPYARIEELSELALEEKWYYGEPPAPGQEKYPILRNYLNHTFKRLVSEKKVRYETDPEHGEYAAFNTGLVDRKYENIYALFKQNTRELNFYWYLVAFVVNGEEMGGKTLVNLFNPLPERANYFENKIENMLYDTSTGELSCDYTHILTERTYRLPLDFLKEHCSEILEADIDEMYHRPLNKAKKDYFAALGEQIRNNPRILNRLKNRMKDAVDLAKKRVEWNYKTAIPMYFPTKKRGSLLLPLALADEDHVDLALVVERTSSGAYQGQTILTLDLAYNNSRLVARPDSDWLKTDLIPTADANDLDDNE